MAPKSTASTAAAVTAKTGTSSAVSGLQLSAAQWKAYNAAFTAAARNARLQQAARQLRASRLQSAATVQAKAAAAHTAARTAAIAQFAASQTYRQSRLANQNAALQQRVFAAYEQHIRAAARLQFAYKGEKAYAHEAVMRTLTSAQALTAETAVFAAAAKAAKAATASVTASSPSAASAAITATATAAGLAAARATPAGRTAPRPARDFSRPLAESEPNRLRDGFGDPDGYDCAAAAIANHLLLNRQYRLSGRQYRRLADALGPGPSIREALTVVQRTPPWRYGVPALADFAPVPPSARARAVIGFATEKGAHAAYCSGPAYIVSWGEVLLLADVITPGTQVEEAWALRWERL